MVYMKEKIKNHIEAIEQIIRGYLPKEQELSSDVVRAMNYSVNAGGKRLRPMLMSETYKLFGGNGKVIEPFLSLIHI